MQKVTRSITRLQLKKAGINPDVYLGHIVESATLNVNLLFQTILDRQDKCDFAKLAKSLGVEEPKIIKWGSKEFWKLVPDHIGAVTIDSKGEMLFYKQNYGHYGNYTDSWRGGNYIPKQDRGTIRQHWFVSSMHKPIKAELDFNYIRDRDSKSIVNRPGDRPIFDIKNIDWKMVPKWATAVICTTAGETQIGDNASWIENFHGRPVIRTHYIRPDHTRPHVFIDDQFGYGDFNYIIHNHPKKNVILYRGGKKHEGFGGLK